MRSIRRRLAVAGTIVALGGLTGFAYAAGTTPPAKAPYVASANGSQSTAVSTRASGRKPSKAKKRKTVQAATARPAPLKTRASGHGKHGRGEHEREGRDDAVRTGVDA